MRHPGFAAFATLIACLSGNACASAPDVTHESEYGRRIKAYQAVQPLGETPFGEHINLYSGELSFRQPDVIVEGQGPTISLVRSTASALADGEILMPFAFGNWTLSIPRIETLTDARHGWIGEVARDPAQRCSQLERPFYSVLSDIGWHGFDLLTESGERQQLIRRGPQNTLPGPSMHVNGAPMAFPIVTQQHWQIGCLPALANGEAGQGFFAVAPNGTKYWLDHLVYDGARRLHEREYGTILRQGRRLATMFVTRIEDRFGNALTFDYGGDDTLDAITGTDGRRVTLTWRTDARLIDRITVQPASPQPRTWRYEYANVTAESATLVGVVQPDGSRWGFDLLNIGGAALTNSSECHTRTRPNATTSRMSTLTHPSGLIGRFWVTDTWHARSYVPSGCTWLAMGEADPYEDNSPLFGTASVTRKEFSGPGMAAQAWTYAYQAAAGSTTKDACASTTTCADTTWVQVVDPAGHRTTYTFSNRWGAAEGKLLRIDTYQGATGAPLRSEIHAYAAHDQGPWPTSLGTAFDDARANGAKAVTWTPTVSRQIVQQGKQFQWQAVSFDTRANPLTVMRSSNVGTGYSRTDTTAWTNNLPLWVVGLPLSSTNVDTGLVESRTVYDAATALPVETYAFGKLKQKITYAANGTVATVSDGKDTPTFDTTVRFSNWKRGVPQTITFPDGHAKSAVVDDLGLVRSVDDELGHRTCYDFDVMGRLARITWPSETTTRTCDTSKWNATHRTFQPAAEPELGLPAGHWKETVATGSGFRVTHYDGLWRPVIEQRFDNAAKSATLSQHVTRYAPQGGVAFRSFAQRGISHYATVTSGTRTTYDALGRPIRAEQDSELGVLATTYEYRTGFQTRVTPPRGNATLTTQYLAFDQPTTDMPLVVAHPEGAITNFSRDVFGKTLSIARRNADSSKVAMRTWTFDTHQRLCRTTEPETGATLMGYDAAGNLAWSASGLPATTPCEPDGASPAVLARKSTRTYDNRHRITALDFADGIGRQTWTYWPDGLPNKVWTYNGANGAVGVANAYRYNSRRLLGGAGESLEQAGWYTWSHGFGYDRNGFNTVQVYPDNLTLTYAVNGLGQATGITATGGGAFVSGATYHPNGALAGFTHGNGIVHSLTQNARGLPDRSRALNGAAAVHDLSYDYDGNGNVVAISDGLAGARYNRSMTYDGLDRLKTTASPMYNGTIAYTYDVLDNIETLRAPAMQGAGTRAQRYCYDSTNRLRFIRVGAPLPVDCNSGAAQTTFAFDAQGNLANKNGQAYVFSQDNRLREVSGKESYRYDAQGRRILSAAAGLGNLFFFYTHDGRMVYETDSRRGKLIDYIYFAGSLVATRETSTADKSVVVKYQHTDALGTPVAQTGANRAVLERSEYEPYGRLMNRPIDDRIGFTGHMQDTQTGLTYMQQRYYDPVAGVFLSADPVAVRSAGDNFHRYRYANNNPYRYVDPDGRETAMFQAERYQMPPPDPAATRTALGLIADFTPGVGDAMGIYEALQEPSVFNVLGAGVGLVPVVGDVGGKLIKNADNIANGAAGLWTATKSQTVAENAFRHFKEHGADFDARNAVEYVRQAAEFLHRPGAGVLSRTRANGDVVRFDPASNAFGVMDKSGAPRTFFKPDPAQHGYPTNLDYFDVQ